MGHIQQISPSHQCDQNGIASLGQGKKEALHLNAVETEDERLSGSVCNTSVYLGYLGQLQWGRPRNKQLSRRCPKRNCGVWALCKYDYSGVGKCTIIANLKRFKTTLNVECNVSSVLCAFRFQLFHVKAFVLSSSRRIWPVTQMRKFSCKWIFRNRCTINYSARG